MKKVIGMLIVFTLLVNVTGFGYSTSDLSQNSKNKIEKTVMKTVSSFVSVDKFEGVHNLIVVDNSIVFNDKTEKADIDVPITGRKIHLKPPLSYTKTILNYGEAPNTYKNLYSIKSLVLKFRKARDGLTC